jgi:cytoskeletal protein CcmA (bactofilin family)
MNQIVSLGSIAIALLTLAGCRSDEIHVSSDHSFPFRSSNSLSGSVSLANKQMDNLQACGTIRIDNVSVAGDVKINGTLSGDRLKVSGVLAINGTCIMSNMHINGTTNINGFLNANNSNFSKIEMSTKKLVLVNSAADSILIRKPGLTETQQQIIDLDNTTIKGDICFENGDGKIIVRNSSKIYGSITGGTLETT